MSNGGQSKVQGELRLTYMKCFVLDVDILVRCIRRVAVESLWGRAWSRPGVEDTVYIDE